MLSAIRECPGCSKTELAANAGVAKEALAGPLRSLVANKQIRTEGKTNSRRYFPFATDIAPPSSPNGNGEGPRTAVERRICEAVTAIGLTAPEIASSTQTSERQVRDIAASLVRRGVLTSYGNGDRPVFEMPQAAAA